MSIYRKWVSLVASILIAGLFSFVAVMHLGSDSADPSSAAVLNQAAYTLAVGNNDVPEGFVTVLAPENPPSPEGLGAVGGLFAIARLETSNAEYAAFLNAVARDGDPHGLWSPNMSSHFWGGVAREPADPEAPPYQYVARSGYQDLPVSFVSWWDAVRYVNWLHFDRPSPGIAGFGVTEGDDVHGAYDTRDLRVSVRRNAGARFFLPTRDEWIKAAFYDAETDGGRWWAYATRSDEPPRAGPPTDAANTANYFVDGWAAPYPHLTHRGAYAGSPSAFGTFDQAGNVHEWIEDGDGHSRQMLGGALFMHSSSLARDYLDGEYSTESHGAIGFRVAAAYPPHAVVALPRVQKSLSDIESTSEAPDGGGHSDDGFMAFVTIGEPRNPRDPIYGFGSVGYVFDLGKYEITNTQYAAFLNAVARYDDPWGLWHRDMATGVVGGIYRTQHDGSAYEYFPKEGWDKRPVTYVSWYDLTRFANWLHYGRPNTGRSEMGTTEGDDTRGAYDTRAHPQPGETPDYRAQPLRRNAGALYWLPSQDEWFKAAYYDSMRPGSRKYWDFPVRTSDQPVAEPPPGGPHSVAMQGPRGLAVGGPYFISEVDAYMASSYFGVKGMGGNVWEWLEDWHSRGDSTSWRGNEWTRALRGVSFNYFYRGLHAMNADPGEPSHKYFVYGGRIARAPNRTPIPVSGSPDVVERAISTVKALPLGMLLSLAFLAGIASAAVLGLYLLPKSRRNTMTESGRDR
ncbi:MAG: SUMF1/EgtB/PvdO family nonheme iron enzyme [Thiobacillus sp.]